MGARPGWELDQARLQQGEGFLHAHARAHRRGAPEALRVRHLPDLQGRQDLLQGDKLGGHPLREGPWDPVHGGRRRHEDRRRHLHQAEPARRHGRHGGSIEPDRRGLLLQPPPARRPSGAVGRRCPHRERGLVAVMPVPCAFLFASLPSPPSPVAFEVGPLALSYYGLCIVLGIAVATWLTGKELARSGRDPTLALEALLLVVPLGVVGARIYYVVANLDTYAEPFRAGLEIWIGGLGIYGAIAGGLVGLVIFAWLRGVSALAFADAAAPGIVLGQAVGRWGD